MAWEKVLGARQPSAPRIISGGGGWDVQYVEGVGRVGISLRHMAADLVDECSYFMALDAAGQRSVSAGVPPAEPRWRRGALHP